MNMRTSISTLIIAFVLILSTPPAKAADAEGAGLATCATVMQDQNQDKNREEFYFSWTEGFMSGLNIARLNDEPNKFKSLSTEEQKTHIRDFCNTNPAAKYFKAALDLYITLYPKNAEEPGGLGALELNNK